MHVIESIGPVLGIVAFLGLAILAFLLFEQARDIRRLRDWAGRAPERAEEAAQAVQAAAEASRAEGEEAEAEEAGRGFRGTVGAAWGRVTGAVVPRLARYDRRLPVDGRYLLAVVALAVIAAGVVTDGFGLLGNDGRQHKHGSGGKPTVAILNGTSVSGLAARVEQQVVKATGYKAGAVTNSGSTFTNTVVMYKPGRRAQAKALATSIKPKLGETPTQEMTNEVMARADGAPLALGLGLDDSRFGS